MDFLLPTFQWKKLKKWIENNPNLGNDLMERNKSFVFFKISENSKRGPTGSIGYPLTPLRSIAIDSNEKPDGVFVLYKYRRLKIP